MQALAVSFAFTTQSKLHPLLSSRETGVELGLNSSQPTLVPGPLRRRMTTFKCFLCPPTAAALYM